MKRKDNKKRWVVVAYLMLLCVLFLVGVACDGSLKNVDLEDMEFASFLAVEQAKEGYQFILATYDEKMEENGNATDGGFTVIEAETLKEAKKKYESSHRGTLALGHCKVFVLGQELFEDQERSMKLFEEIRSDGDLPKSTKICVSKPGSTYESDTLSAVLDGILSREENKETFMDSYVKRKEGKEVSAPIFTIEKDRVTREGIIRR